MGQNRFFAPRVCSYAFCLFAACLPAACGSDKGDADAAGGADGGAGRDAAGHAAVGGSGARGDASRHSVLDAASGADDASSAASGGAGEEDDASRDGARDNADAGGNGSDEAGAGTCATAGDELLLHANIETMGVVMQADGLPEQARLRYREADAESWIEGHHLTRIDDGRLAGSLFKLAPDTEYWVRVTAPGVDICGSAETQSHDIAFSPSRTLYVDASAAAGGDGSRQAPFRSIQEGVDAATAGTRVLVADGVYHEHVACAQSGGPNAWIQVMAEGDAAVLDGSVTLESNSWTPLSSAQGVWATEVEQSSFYLARDGRRFYRYDDADGLRNRLGDDQVPMDEGWYAEPGQTTLLVAVEGQPQDHTWNLPRLDSAFSVDGNDYIWIEGFEIRFYGQGQYGRGIDLKNASHIVIRNNTIHGVPDGIVVLWTEGEDRGNHTRIEHNEIFDPPVDEWPWDAVKGTSMEGSGIVVGGRQGAIVRGNRVHHFFNGIYTGRWGELENTSISFDVDVYDNQIHHIGDDGFEPEGSCINNRFRNNEFSIGLVGISLAPITSGPLWVLESVFSDYSYTSFKWSNDSDGMVFIYHNTSWTDRADLNAMSIGNPVHNAVMRNNIFRGTRYAFESTLTGLSGHDWDYDNWHTTRDTAGSPGPHFKWENQRYDTMADLCTATGLECNGHEQDPGLADPSSGDFSLLSTSVNIDRGVVVPGIDQDHCGSAPDIGAEEWCGP